MNVHNTYKGEGEPGEERVKMLISIVEFRYVYLKKNQVTPKRESNFLN